MPGINDVIKNSLLSPERKNENNTSTSLTDIFTSNYVSFLQANGQEANLQSNSINSAAQSNERIYSEEENDSSTLKSYNFCIYCADDCNETQLTSG